MTVRQLMAELEKAPPDARVILDASGRWDAAVATYLLMAAENEGHGFPGGLSFVVAAGR